MQKKSKRQLSTASRVPVPPVQKRPLTREIVRSPGFVSIYSNDVQVQTSPWDLRLIFSELTDHPSPESITVNQLAELRVSPQLAKKLTMVMVQLLTEYEEEFGKIPLKDND